MENAIKNDVLLINNINYSNEEELMNQPLNYFNNLLTV